ncbi:hypothetical protein YC2023_105706 [Brassica napus]
MILSKCYQHITNKQNLKVDIRVRQRIRFNFVGDPSSWESPRDICPFNNLIGRTIKLFSAPNPPKRMREANVLRSGIRRDGGE